MVLVALLSPFQWVWKGLKVAHKMESMEREEERWEEETTVE